MAAERGLFPYLCSTWRGIFETEDAPEELIDQIYDDYRCGE
jgi:hypothetical protein